MINREGRQLKLTLILVIIVFFLSAMRLLIVFFVLTLPDADVKVNEAEGADSRGC